MKKIILILLITVTVNAVAQTPGEKLAATVLNIWKDTVPIGSNTKWSYDMGVILEGFKGLWMNTGNADYWYHRAGKERPAVTLSEEWDFIVKSLV